jgi:hypothetical protein
MKTKEIDLWVEYDGVMNSIKRGTHLGNEISANRNCCSSSAVKAKLIIELPEQKVEITENQLDRLWIKYNLEGKLEDIKKQLGFK